MVTAQNGTDDWQATYDGIMDGTNYYDTIVGFSVMMQSDVGYDYEAVQAYSVSAGTSFAITSEVENSDIGTENWKETGMVSLDMFSGEQEVNFGGMAWETKLVEKLQAPSLDDKYVMDVLAFPMDLLLTGLPEYFEKLENAAPEFMQMYRELLMQILDEAGLGDFVSGFIVMDEAAEEITIETVEEAPGDNTNTTVNNKIEDF